MGWLEDIGKAIGHAFGSIGDFIWGGLVDGWGKLLLGIEKHTIGFIEEEIAEHSLETDLITDPELKKKVEELKEKWKHSPGDWTDIANDIIGIVGGFGAKVQLEALAGVEFGDDDKFAKGLFGQMALVTQATLIAQIFTIVGSAIPGTNLHQLGYAVLNYLNYSGMSQITGFGYGQILNSALAKPMQQEIYAKIRPEILDVGIALRLYYRKQIPYSQLYGCLKKHGYNDEDIVNLIDSYLYYPSPPELVNWSAKEVFEPEMIEKYGLDDEFENLELDAFYRAGMNTEQIRNHWRAHWEHPGFNQMRELLQREQLTEQDMWDWFRLVEIPPYWRQKLINISWNIPTRVDVRRFWDMGTITEDRLREIYGYMGYHGKDLDDYVLWTKVYVAWPDLIARYQKGWINIDTVRAELLRLGMTEERAQELIETKVKPEAPVRVLKERDLVKDDILEGVTNMVVTVPQAREMLIQLGYDANEADFIIFTYLPTEEMAPALYYADKEACEAAGFIWYDGECLNAEQVKQRKEWESEEEGEGEEEET